MKKRFSLMITILLLCVMTPILAKATELSTTTITSIKKETAYTISINYKRVSNATSYEIYMKKGNGSFKKVKTTKALTYKTGKLATNATYYFQVKAIDEDGTASDPSKTASIKLPKPKIVAIDAGHQAKGNSSLEPIGPGSSKKKPKVASGTTGVATRVPEYKLTLAMSKKVQAELIKRGYEVVMIRTTHNVNISNSQRAKIANKSGADIFIRIHANGSTNRSVNGALTIYPTTKNPFIPSISKNSKKLSQTILTEFCKATKAKNGGMQARDDLSGSNWSKIPVTVVEMGYMSNAKEDRLMQTAAYQKKMTTGICNGIDKYFK